MYNLIQKIHLFCGLIILVFLMMYFVSGFMMVHRPWFSSPPPPATRESAPLLSSRDQPLEKFAAQLQDQLKLVGRIQFPAKQPADMTRFWIDRPGVMIRVDVPAREQQVYVTTQRTNWFGTLVMLHKIAGYDREVLFDLVAFFCDLAGVSMILFAISGVYLWWKRVRNHTWGIVCLTVSCTYAIGVMMYLAYAK